MLVSGITSSVGEQCLINAGSAGVALEPCLEAVAAGDGREVMQFDEDGQILSDGLCLGLADGDTHACLTVAFFIGRDFLLRSAHPAVP